MSLRLLQKKAVEMRVETVDMIHKSGSGHSGAAVSSIEILISLYYGQLGQNPVMHFDSTSPGWPMQDYFVLSKYTASAALYSILADVGFFDRKDLEGFRKMNGRLQAFAHVKINGVHASVGSRGHGLSVALGMALSLKREKKENRVFTLIEDRELQVGQTWEAAMAAGHYKVDNLMAFVEDTGCQSDGVMRKVMNVEPIVEKFESLGWKVLKVNDGHDFDKILSAIKKGFSVKRRPVAIVCKTEVGKGIPFAEGKGIYYDAALSDAEMKEFLDYSERMWRRI